MAYEAFKYRKLSFVLPSFGSIPKFHAKQTHHVPTTAPESVKPIGQDGFENVKYITSELAITLSHIDTNAAALVRTGFSAH
jgi:hypothetical protein